MEYLQENDPEIAALVNSEEARIENTLNLIAAENHSPRCIMEVMGSILNTKTIEGYPGNRFHAGCEHVDDIERLAVMRACTLFGAEYANVQPHSGTSANLAVYFSVLDVGDRILAMNLSHGGHLSHGHHASMTSKCFTFEHYTVDPETELIDYGLIRQKALKFKPKMIIAGASSYPRLIDYRVMAEISREVSAFFMADIAHLAGLIAGKVIPSPVPHCDFVTFTSYKTLMGGRGGIILARNEYAKRLDRAVFPGGQGTSSVNMIAAKAVIFKMAMKQQFATLQQKVLDNAVTMAEWFMKNGYRLVTGGTENHQVLLDITDMAISAGQAEKALEQAGIILNRNVVPKDGTTPGKCNGLRIGTGAITSRKMGQKEMVMICEWINQILQNPGNTEVQKQVRTSVKELCYRFPVYGESNDTFTA